MDGAANGVKSMAVSLAWISGPGENYDVAAQVAAKLVRYWKDRDFPARTYFNVNVPATHEHPLRGFKWTRMGCREYARAIHQKGERDGHPIYYLGGHLSHTPSENGDCDAVAAGYVSITPVTLEKTNFAALASLADRDVFSGEL